MRDVSLVASRRQPPDNPRQDMCGYQRKAKVDRNCHENRFAKSSRMSVPVATVERGRQACAFGSVQESLQKVRNASTRSHMHLQAGRESVDISAKVGVAFPRRTIGSV